MTGFQVVPESFGPVASQFQQIGEQVQQAWGPVREQSMAVRFGRGDDMVSPLIQVSLQGAVEIMDASMRSVTKALSDYADGLNRMAGSYSDAETSTKTMLTTPTE